MTLSEHRYLRAISISPVKKSVCVLLDIPPRQMLIADSHAACEADSLVDNCTFTVRKNFIVQEVKPATLSGLLAMSRG